MQRPIRWLFLSAILLLATTNSFAVQIKAYVAPFSVTGAANGAELKLTLQDLLMSRLSNDSIMAVESADVADVNVKGSYIGFGKVFSIDTVAKGRDGKILVRAFEQGETQEDMLSAIGKVAKTLAAGIEKNYLQSGTPQPAVVAAPRVVPVAPPSDIVRPESVRLQSGSGWISQKLEGELTGITMGRKLADGERELFITANHRLQYYRLGKELKRLAEVTLPVHQKILGVDTADLDGDGIPEIYLTVMSNDDLASQVWVAEGNDLKKVAENLPYYFRVVNFQGEVKRIYAQEKGPEADFYGNLLEVVKKGAVFSVKNPLKLPRGANIYNTGVIKTKEGKNCFIVLNGDGYLVVFDENGKDLWTSSDKYGGSENYFSREDLQDMRVTGSPRRNTFLEQRITITRNGEIIVPKNDGFFNIGNNRSYTKNSVFAFAWNGLMLEELWHTKQSQSYLADYQYDEEQKQLLLLEIIKKEGLLDKGASAISTKRVE